MWRRQFIALVGGAAAWPVAARAQQPQRARLIGVLLPAAADDPVFQPWVGAFLQGLALSGWTLGRNVRLDTRWAMTAADIRKHAAELVAFAPDVILAHGAVTVGPLLQATRTVPIVFPVAGDPVAAGLVDSLARPGGNATGFMIFEYSLSGKWLELLKQIAPGVTSVAVLRDPGTPSGPAQFGIIQAVAPSHGVEITPVNVRDAGEIERAVAAFARLEWRSDRARKRVGAVSSRSDHHAGGPAQAARDLSYPLLRRRWGSGFLWAQFHRPVPGCGRLHRPHPQGREAGRPPGADADQV